MLYFQIFNFFIFQEETFQAQKIKRTHFLCPSLKKQKKFASRKLLILKKMKLSGSNINKFLVFSQEKVFFYINLKKFLIFQETEFSYIKLLIFQEVIFWARKKKKKTLKMFFIFWEMELYSTKLQKHFIFQEKLSKPENQTKSFSLEVPTSYCIRYSLAVLFTTLGLLITHLIIDI